MKQLVVLFIFIGSILGSAQNFDFSDTSEFLSIYVSEDGLVDYKSITKETINPILNQYVQNTPKDNWSKNEKLAYWINAYNVFTIKLIVDNYPVESIKYIDQAWNLKFIPIDGEPLSLNYVEHEIIRKMNEPRIHFALVCAAISCPKLNNKAFVPESLDADLNRLTQRFLADEAKNILSKSKIEISKIFQWFTGDFKSKDQSLIDFLNRYAPITITKNAKIKFRDYNWSLNEQ